MSKSLGMCVRVRRIVRVHPGKVERTRQAREVSTPQDEVEALQSELTPADGILPALGASTFR